MPRVQEGGAEPSPGVPAHTVGPLSPRDPSQPVVHSDRHSSPTQPIPVHPLASQGLRHGLGAGAVLRVFGVQVLF